MKTTSARLCGGALALVLSGSAALAAATDYRFELVSTDHRVGSGSVLALRLTDLRTGAPVAGAVIYATRMDMAPEGMATMTAPVTAMPSDVPGTYRFATDLVMAGGWRFSVAAKVQGEPETVSAALDLRAAP
ncbi:MAG: FixH family protein [Pseudomonadota bacterium]